MLGKTFFFMILISICSAVIMGRIDEMGIGFAASLSDAVNLCISLLGMMCFWSGFMNVLRESGALKLVTKAFEPLLRIIYGKDLSEDNLETLSASVSANFLGLGNAALPLGINAVKGFEKNNKTLSASDSTIMFAVLNTVPFQLIPSTLIAMRTNYGAENPFDVVPCIWLCSLIINVFAVIACKMMSFRWGSKR